MNKSGTYNIDDFLTEIGQARCAMGKVYFPNTPWADRVVNQCVGFPAGKHDDAVDVCALIGLALDETNPAYVPKPTIQKPLDRWDKAFLKAEEASYNWKVA